MLLHLLHIVLKLYNRLCRLYHMGFSHSVSPFFSTRYLYSGASIHMSIVQHNWSNLKPYTRSTQVSTANGDKVKFLITIQEIAWNSFRFFLISLLSVSHQTIFCVVFSYGWVIHDQAIGKLIEKGHRSQRLFALNSILQHKSILSSFDNKIYVYGIRN